MPSYSTDNPYNQQYKTSYMGVIKLRPYVNQHLDFSAIKQSTGLFSMHA